ncbi:hypothetical protein L915_14643 [Phytophthora nicotianae]|uniref:Uncharacterized protein n=1 Tax=Phytophthora nicotianae TaxID=4792 RepID=W2G8Y0_PHYNI|nr:hypothetical protein L915_14643 [Phytophthora nicotianae]
MSVHHRVLPCSVLCRATPLGDSNAAVADVELVGHGRNTEGEGDGKVFLTSSGDAISSAGMRVSTSVMSGGCSGVIEVRMSLQQVHSYW